jgi:hypothetical protein
MARKGKNKKNYRTISYPLLHVYGQGKWHSPVHIIGNREGLMNLRDAINEALNFKIAEHECTTNDGEGFVIKVAKVTQNYDDLRLPYYKEVAKDTRDEVTSPEDLFPIEFS